MNRKVYKKVRRHAESILLDWVKSLSTEEEITSVNIKDYLPKHGYIPIEQGNKVNFYTERWAVREVKKLVLKGHILNDITMRDLESAQKRK